MQAFSSMQNYTPLPSADSMFNHGGSRGDMVDAYRPLAPPFAPDSKSLVALWRIKRQTKLARQRLKHSASTLRSTFSSPFRKFKGKKPLNEGVFFTPTNPWQTDPAASTEIEVMKEFGYRPTDTQAFFRSICPDDLLFVPCNMDASRGLNMRFIDLANPQMLQLNLIFLSEKLYPALGEYGWYIPTDWDTPYSYQDRYYREKAMFEIITEMPSQNPAPMETEITFQDVFKNISFERWLGELPQKDLNVTVDVSNTPLFQTFSNLDDASIIADFISPKVLETAQTLDENENPELPDLEISDATLNGCENQEPIGEMEDLEVDDQAKDDQPVNDVSSLPEKKEEELHKTDDQAKDYQPVNDVQYLPEKKEDTPKDLHKTDGQAKDYQPVNDVHPLPEKKEEELHEKDDQAKDYQPVNDVQSPLEKNGENLLLEASKNNFAALLGAISDPSENSEFKKTIKKMKLNSLSEKTVRVEVRDSGIQSSPEGSKKRSCAPPNTAVENQANLMNSLMDTSENSEISMIRRRMKLKPISEVRVQVRHSGIKSSVPEVKKKPFIPPIVSEIAYENRASLMSSLMDTSANSEFNQALRRMKISSPEVQGRSSRIHNSIPEAAVRSRKPFVPRISVNSPHENKANLMSCLTDTSENSEFKKAVRKMKLSTPPEIKVQVSRIQKGPEKPVVEKEKPISPAVIKKAQDSQANLIKALTDSSENSEFKKKVLRIKQGPPITFGIQLKKVSRDVEREVKGSPELLSVKDRIKLLEGIATSQ